METLQTDIFNILRDKLKSNFIYNVTKETGCLGGQYLKIWIACSTIDINNVSGQKPQLVSLMLDLKSLELNPQVFGGNGGQCIYREPNLQDAKEKYLAMKSVKIPFRRPQPIANKVVECVGRFADNYIKTLKENKDVLRYKNLVNYDEILG